MVVGLVVAVGLAGAGGILRFALDLKDMWRKRDADARWTSPQSDWPLDNPADREQHWTYQPPPAAKDE